MDTIPSRDEFEPIKIGENLAVWCTCPKVTKTKSIGYLRVPLPLFQNDEFCMQFHFHPNQSYFHKNGVSHLDSL